MFRSRAVAIAVFACAVFVIDIHAATTAITFDSPRGGEVYAIGQAQQIRLGAKTKAKSVIVELSRDGGTNFESLGSIDNSGKDINKRNVLLFTVTGPASSNCVIKASAVIGKTTVIATSLPFSIGSAGLPLEGSITAPAMAPGSVVTGALADGSVTNPKLAASAVSTDKITSGAASPGMVLAADGSGGVGFVTPSAAATVATAAGTSIVAAINDPATSGTLNGYVRRAGDTMAGALTLSGDPTAATHAATKQYVDAKSGAVSGVAASAGNSVVTALNSAATTTTLNAYVKKAGDTMTGPLALSADPTATLHAATKQYVDNADSAKVSKAGDTMAGALTVNGAIEAASSSDIKITVASTNVANGAAINLQCRGNANSPRMEWQLIGSDTDQQSYMRANYAGATTVANIMCIKGNGNVGIGTTSPAAALHVVGGASFTGGLTSLSFGSAVGSAIDVTPTGNVFVMSAGTNNVVNILGTGIRPGTFITVICQNPAFQFTTTGNLRLQGGVNFTTSPNDTITFVFDGSVWYEVCRSVN
ncbi:MAG TPA: hypothetical protein VGP72_05470 [Planctomycetota bacterium]|jgi:hypothetical protein